MRTAALILAAVLANAGTAHAASVVVNQTIDVQPGTRLVVTQGGATLMSKAVEPGRVRVFIEYLDHAVRRKGRR